MTIVLIPLANGAIVLAEYLRNRPPSSRSLRLREQSYPSNDEEQYFPSTRNAPESNGKRWSGPVMRGEKRGGNRPVRTIARAGIRPPLIAPRPVLLAAASRNRRRRGSRCLRVLNARHHGSSPVRFCELNRGEIGAHARAEGKQHATHSRPCGLSDGTSTDL